MSLFNKLFGTSSDRFLKANQSIASEINSRENEMAALSDEDLRERSLKLKQKHSEGVSLDDLLPEAFALVRESAKRTLKQRHYDVQLLGGIALHKGKIAEMRTGEGKTLVATLPAYLNALTGKGAHIVTVNDYLARRDAAWMGQVYHLLGMGVACVTQDGAYAYDPSFDPTAEPAQGDSTQSFMVHHKSLRPVSRQEAYARDVVYATNNTIGFDYLRDNLAYDKSQMVQRPFYFAIIDEVDSILIDEARTPLIISGADKESSEMYKTFARIIPRLARDKDYEVDEKMRSVVLTEQGIVRVEELMGVKNIYEEADIERIFHLEQALKANVLYKKDHHYVIKDGKVVIVDEFTGRLMPDRRFSEGIHQALEAKEGVEVKQETRTLATITFQNLFRKYPKLSGMTGTAFTSEEEFFKVYGLEVAVVPTNRPMVRIDHPDKIFATEQGKIKAIIKEIAERQRKGQPVLIGTISIEKNELISKALESAHIPFEVLNAKNHEREGNIIAQAGRKGAVMVATNMAGRGVDIMLGGNPPDPATAKEVKALGGLFVIGTERHEARRIDNQLRGRSGRQGDPGETQFYVSMEDDVMRIFGSDRAKNMMKTLGLPEDEAIQHGMISKALEKAQEKIEGFHFDTRKHVLEYDEVLNKQREAIYRMRREALFADDPSAERPLRELIFEMARDTANDVAAAATAAETIQGWDFSEIEKAWRMFLPSDFQDFEKTKIEQLVKDRKDITEARNAVIDHLVEKFKLAFEGRVKTLGEAIMRQAEKIVVLSSTDTLWTAHLDTMDHLRESVRLRAYGQVDPLVEYKKEGGRLFEDLKALIANQVLGAILKIAPVAAAPAPRPVQGTATKPMPLSPIGGNTANTSNTFSAGSQPTSQKEDPRYKNVGRNDMCPCGSGKKYKKCHGK